MRSLEWAVAPAPPRLGVTMFCENGRSAIHVLNCEKCVKVRRRETTWDRRDSSPGSRAGREPRARASWRGRPGARAARAALGALHLAKLRVAGGGAGS
jgi:hypothetical protein